MNKKEILLLQRKATQGIALMQVRAEKAETDKKKLIRIVEQLITSIDQHNYILQETATDEAVAVLQEITTESVPPF